MLCAIWTSFFLFTITNANRAMVHTLAMDLLRRCTLRILRQKLFGGIPIPAYLFPIVCCDISILYSIPGELINLSRIEI